VANSRDPLVFANAPARRRLAQLAALATTCLGTPAHYFIVAHALAGISADAWRRLLFSVKSTLERFGRAHDVCRAYGP